ncbi:MAG: hypothetical protein DWI48_06215 [Chloroflexi bacterium]|nr:MAG: hypothetical protein DWI48_06215 [Chloroflexota bacterium]
MSTAQRPLSLRTFVATLTFAMALVLAMLGRPAPASAQVSAMLPDQLKNLAYPLDTPAPRTTVQLRDGKYDSRAVLGPTAAPLAVTFVLSSTSADFSAVLLATNTGGSGVFTTLHLVRAQNGIATAGPGLFLGDRLKIEGIARSDQDCIIVAFVTQGPNDPQCCPTKRETREYVPDGNTFRLVLIDGVAPAQAQTPVVPRTGNLGTQRTSTNVALLAILAAAALPLVARRLVRSEARA